MTIFCPLSTQPVFDAGGRTVVGAYVRLYDAGTTTPRAAYSDGLAGAAYAPNGIRTDSSGCIPSIWVQGAPYRVRITSPGGSLIRDVDNLPGDATSGGGGGGSGDSVVITGDIVWSYRDETRLGWVRLNGRSIGNATSGATERANSDCQSLFDFLWNRDATLAVTGGRGSNSASDWAANKSIALPDARGRSIVGLDTMGTTTAGRLVGAYFASGDNITLGSAGGAASATLAIANLPTFTVGGTTVGVGDHVHSASTGAAGGHTPAGTADAVADHTHNFSFPNPTPVAPGAVNVNAGAASPASTTGAGGHGHSLTMSPVPDHVHSVTINGAGAHAHPFTSDPIGSGTAYNNMPPFILCTCYMKL